MFDETTIERNEDMTGRPLCLKNSRAQPKERPDEQGVEVFHDDDDRQRE